MRRARWSSWSGASARGAAARADSRRLSPRGWAFSGTPSRPSARPTLTAAGPRRARPPAARRRPARPPARLRCHRCCKARLACFGLSGEGRAGERFAARRPDPQRRRGAPGRRARLRPTGRSPRMWWSTTRSSRTASCSGSAWRCAGGSGVAAPGRARAASCPCWHIAGSAGAWDSAPAPGCILPVLAHSELSRCLGLCAGG